MGWLEDIGSWWSGVTSGQGSGSTQTQQQAQPPQEQTPPPQQSQGTFTGGQSGSDTRDPVTQGREIYNTYYDYNRSSNQSQSTQPVQQVQETPAVRNTSWDTPNIPQSLAAPEYVSSDAGYNASLARMQTGDDRIGRYPGADFGKAGQNNYNTPATQQMLVNRLTQIGQEQQKGNLTPQQAQFGVSEMSRQYGYTPESLQGVVNYGQAKEQFMSTPRDASELGLPAPFRSTGAPIMGGAESPIDKPRGLVPMQYVSAPIPLAKPDTDRGMPFFVSGGGVGDRGQTVIEQGKMEYGETGGAFGIMQLPRSVYENEGFTRKYGFVTSSGGPGALQSGQFSWKPLSTNIYTQESGGKELSLKYSDPLAAAQVAKNPLAYPRLGAEAYGGTVGYQPLDNRTLIAGTEMSRYNPATGNVLFRQ